MCRSHAVQRSVVSEERIRVSEERVSEENAYVSEENVHVSEERVSGERSRSGGDLIPITHLMIKFSCLVFRCHNGEKFLEMSAETTPVG